MIGMRITIDRAGRLVVPKELRDAVGISAGPVEVTVVGAGIRIEPVVTDDLVERDGRLVIAAGDGDLTVDDVRALRRRGRR